MQPSIFSLHLVCIMIKNSVKSITLWGGIAGCLSVISYFSAVFLENIPHQITFLFVMAFAILGIIFFFALKEYINAKTPNYANELSFMFGKLAFTICAIFLSAQLAVQVGIEPNAKIENLKEIKGFIRLIDLGIDVAWDLFISTHLILFAVASYKTSFKWHGVGLFILGWSLLFLNVMSFPEPPADKNLIDVGPFIALTWFVMGIHLAWIGYKMPNNANLGKSLATK
jgi:hypothetical protein